MLRKLRCWLLGHRYYVIQEFSKTDRRLGCRNCKKTWGMNDNQCCLLDWDSELEEMYEDMGYEIINPQFTRKKDI